MGEGLLAKFVLDAIGIAEDTAIDDLLQFREDHDAELGHFRSELGKLASTIDPETPSVEALQQQVEDIYKNEISPAVSDLRAALQRSKIRNLVTHLTSFVFAGSINFLAPQGTVENVVTSAGFQLLAKTVNFALDRGEQLSNDPYTFVLAVEDNVS
jgi:hypothetical protein